MAKAKSQAPKANKPKAKTKRPTLGDKITALEKEVAWLKKELGERNQLVSTQRSELQAEYGVKKDLQRRTAEKDAQIHAAQNEIRNRIQEIDELRNQNRSLENLVNGLEKTNSDLNESLENIALKLVTVESAFKEQARILSQKDEEDS